MKKLPPFDKYEYYIRSVQDPEETLGFIDRTYRRIFGRDPLVFGEDFCGTFLLSCDWVKRGPKRRSIGVDLDPEPLVWGMSRLYPALSAQEQTRVQAVQNNVLNPKLPKVDVIGSLNFSYYIFKERETMLAYFKNCRRRLSGKGVLVLDGFGGAETLSPNEEYTDHDGFRYYWDQMSFDPITHDAKFFIHYKRKGEKKRQRVFQYDWRMWTLPELKDVLKDAGFRHVEIHWEGTTKKGEGNGIFRQVTRAESCEAWIVYLVAHG